MQEILKEVFPLKMKPEPLSETLVNDFSGLFCFVYL